MFWSSSGVYLSGVVYSTKVAVRLHVRLVLREIIDSLMRIPCPGLVDVNHVKMIVAAKYSLDKVPSNSEIIRLLDAEEKGKVVAASEEEDYSFAFRRDCRCGYD